MIEIGSKLEITKSLLVNKSETFSKVMWITVSLYPIKLEKKKLIQINVYISKQDLYI